jgi:hypothetical protein
VAALAHLLLLVLLAISVRVGFAQAADEWVIVNSSGTVWILEKGRDARLASPGTVFPNAATLATAPNGRAFLVHGAESVVVGPSTVLALVQRGGRTRVIQTAGVAEFDVERQNVQHFSVETPFLAAVVKGTRFTVRVGESSADVGVDRGVVEVTSEESRERVEITAGMEASVSANDPRLVVTGGSAPPPAQMAQLAQPAGNEPPSVDDEEGGAEGAVHDLPEGEGPGDDHGHGNDEDHDDEDNPGRSGPGGGDHDDDDDSGGSSS